MASTTPELTRKTVLALTARILAAPERRCQQDQNSKKLQTTEEHEAGEDHLGRWRQPRVEPRISYRPQGRPRNVQASEGRAERRPYLYSVQGHEQRSHRQGRRVHEEEPQEGGPQPLGNHPVPELQWGYGLRVDHVEYLLRAVAHKQD